MTENEMLRDSGFYDLQEDSVVCMCDFCGREVYEGDIIWHDEEMNTIIHDECLLDYAKSILYEKIADEAMLWEADDPCRKK